MEVIIFQRNRANDAGNTLEKQSMEVVMFVANGYNSNREKQGQ